MDPTELYEFLKPKPFQPVRVYCKDGRTFDIRFRELVVVGVTQIKIGIPAPNETLPIYDYLVRVPVTEIDRVERLTGAAASASP